ncbi:hypothetical protein FQR65_LT15911 [Abscondita terminalis]|nr:hypothetical protein FQR65_LT15911 [Abscondita terminalis]
MRIFIKVFLVLATLARLYESKYSEGELKTYDNWAFLSRFCFLSEEGEFEYLIEFNEENGYPNLLLYYDEDNQWPAVYKTNKTCYEKEAVLSIKNHQVVNLSLEYPASGCKVAPTTTTTSTTTASPTFTVNVPTRKWRPTPIATWVNTTDSYFTTAEEEDYLNVTTTTKTSTTKAPVNKRHVQNYYPSAPPRNRVIICQTSKRFQSIRERWWFIAVSNCNGTKGIHIKYRILMTNGPPGDYWHEHFSADQFYILPVLVAYSVAYSLLILAILICTVELKSRQLLHSTYKLFVLSVIIQFFGIVLQTAAYLKFAVNGIGAPTAKTFGNMMMGCSETCFLLMLLLLAKGYTVTRGRLRLGASVKLTIFMCLYSVTYICIFIYEAKVFDPGEVLYLYESPAGYALIVLRIIAWLMFVYSTVFTLKHYPEKSVFYYPFNICGTLWFIAGPAFILSANTYIDKWVRESVVCAVLLFIIFGGHLMFLVLTLPSLANKNFPYHVRTSQIGIMEITGTAGASTIERFGHHVYEPSMDDAEERVIIPLTRRTEQLCTFTKNSNLQSNGDVPEEFLMSENITMQNVLSWSIAKNYTAFDVSRTNREQEEEEEQEEEPGSPTSAQSPTSTTRTNEDADNGSQINGNALHGSYECVKDVPVELFTISRLVGKRDSGGQ